MQYADVIGKRAFLDDRVVALIEFGPLNDGFGHMADHDDAPAAAGHGAGAALVSLGDREGGAAAGSRGDARDGEHGLVRQRLRRRPGGGVRHVFAGIFGTHLLRQRDGTIGPVAGVHHGVAVQQHAERQDHGDRQEYDLKREQRRPALFPQI